MKYIDKIILEWAYRVSDGTPDAHNSAHQLILREILEEFGGEISDINESLDNLNEVSAAAEKAKALGLVSKGYGRWADPKTDKVVAQTIKGQLVPIGKKKVKKEPEKEKPEEKPKKEKKPKSKPKVDKTPQEQELSNEQTKTSDLRDKGVAGAGGETASQGESRYCGAVDNLDYDKFNKENAEDMSW